VHLIKIVNPSDINKLISKLGIQYLISIKIKEKWQREEKREKIPNTNK
jgi:hypothetical protein